jgi:hypothetical protein
MHNNNNPWTTQPPVFPGWFLVKEQRSTGNRYTAVRITKKPFRSELYIGTDGYAPPTLFKPIDIGDEWLTLEKHYPFYHFCKKPDETALFTGQSNLLAGDTEATALAEALMVASGAALKPDESETLYAWMEGIPKEQLCMELGRALRGLGYSIVKN